MFDILHSFSEFGSISDQRLFEQLDALKRHVHSFLVIKAHLTAQEVDSQL